MSVCGSCNSVITLGYSPAAYIDFLIGKLDTQSSSLRPHPPVCLEEKLAACALACHADSSSFSCHRQSSASVIKGFRCVQENLTGWFACSSVSFQPCPAPLPAGWQDCRLPSARQHFLHFHGGHHYCSSSTNGNLNRVAVT